ncbi:MAG: hypothetical protein QOI61_909 [Actinomycetota bacterium]|jgi:sterol desaturase/sphingolipid hydroxylase (fatty acid hydroxylase superfamily)
MTLATPYEIAVNLPYSIALVAVGCEVVWLASRGTTPRRRILRSVRVAAGMAVGGFIASVGYTHVLRALWGALAPYGSAGLAGFWRDHPVVGALAAFVAWDLAGWLYHYIGHHTAVGWAAHQPHHSGEDFDATLGLRQSWAPFHGILHQPLLALAGFDFRVIVVCAAVSNCWQVLEHTSVPLRLPRFMTATVMTPGAHRHHHGTGNDAVNLGPVFTWWDRLAGTWVPADAPAPASYGLGPLAATTSLGIELAGWRQLAARIRCSRAPGGPETGAERVVERRANETRSAGAAVLRARGFAGPNGAEPHGTISSR